MRSQAAWLLLFWRRRRAREFSGCVRGRCGEGRGVPSALANAAAAGRRGRFKKGGAECVTCMLQPQTVASIVSACRRVVREPPKCALLHGVLCELS